MGLGGAPVRGMGAGPPRGADCFTQPPHITSVHEAPADSEFGFEWEDSCNQFRSSDMLLAVLGGGGRLGSTAISGYGEGGERMPGLLQTVFRPLFVGVVVVQGVHVIEHIIQLVQVYVLGIPDDKALGILGYILQLQGTEEWLHLVFNVTYLSALLLLVVPLRGVVPDAVPRWAYAAFLFGVSLEGWHNIEHAVIISNVLRNGGCPCPGIGDVALGITDKVLHFSYNALAYTATLPAFVYYISRTRSGTGPEPRLAMHQI